MSPLTRTLNEMPDFIREALESRGLMDAYHAAPITSKTTTSAGLVAPNDPRPNRNA
jgi:hypothetical protein